MTDPADMILDAFDQLPPATREVVADGLREDSDRLLGDIGTALGWPRTAARLLVDRSICAELREGHAQELVDTLDDSSEPWRTVKEAIRLSIEHGCRHHGAAVHNTFTSSKETHR